MKFKTEQEAIEWVMRNTPFAVKSVAHNSKYPMVYPFSSARAMQSVCDHLGKKLFELSKER